jgi:transcriptional regulator with XRE-family HTH domain
MARYILKRETTADVGQRIKEVRLQLRIQQKEMAETLQMAPSYLSEIESGKANPGPEFFLKMVYEYNVNPNYLFLGLGDMFFGPERILRTEEFDMENGHVDSVEKLFWMMENSPYFKNNILSYASRFFLENEEFLKKSIEKYSSKKEKGKE